MCANTHTRTHINTRSQSFPRLPTPSPHKFVQRGGVITDDLGQPVPTPGSQRLTNVFANQGCKTSMTERSRNSHVSRMRERGVERVVERPPTRTLDPSRHLPFASEMKGGEWYIVLFCQDHLGLVPIPDRQEKQTEFFSELVGMLRALDDRVGEGIAGDRGGGAL